MIFINKYMILGMFSTSGTQTPCVGVSIGIERVFAIMEKKADELKILQTTGIQVIVNLIISIIY